MACMQVAQSCLKSSIVSPITMINAFLSYRDRSFKTFYSCVHCVKITFFLPLSNVGLSISILYLHIYGNVVRIYDINCIIMVYIYTNVSYFPKRFLEMAPVQT